MGQDVSRIRAQRTRSREKQAAKSAGRRSFRHRPLAAFLAAFVCWALAVFFVALDGILGEQAGLSFLIPTIGKAVFLLVSLFLAGMFLHIFDPESLNTNARVVLLCSVCILSLLLARLLLYFTRDMRLVSPEVAVFMLPFVAAPLLSTLLLNSAAGLAAGTWTSLAVLIFAEADFYMVFAALVATVVATQGAQRVRTRTRAVQAGLLAGMASISCVFGITALRWEAPDIMLVLHQAAACLISGFFSAVTVLLILPAFEALFKITTDITLLELSDFSHPLLQRLAIEAPGTYHHSLVVANLAQAAADEIGANSLLVRVCSYFHDIGKLTKPDFFTENQQLQPNPHDELPPSMSTLVITSHVKEGLSLAILHKLPETVKAAIREHHGTSVLSCFHRKAVGQAGGEPDARTAPSGNGRSAVNESDFRYPGPKPTSRESAIISLADSVEAASRSMDKVTPSHIEGLVEDLVNRKLMDGQLAQCDLTLSELTRIKRVFVFTLTNMLHARVPYPKDENRDQQPPDAGQTRSGQTPRPGQAPGEPADRSKRG